MHRIARATLLLLASAAPAAAQPLISHFDSGIEGWTVETRTNPAAAFNFVAAYTPDYVPTGGDSGGYISELDPDNQWSFFRAPASWMGDRSAYAQRRLRFSIRTDQLSYPDGRLVILIGNNNQRISHDTGLPPLNQWTRRDIPLASGSWFVGTNATGTIASQAQIDAILASLTHLYIGLEFGSDALDERVDLDRVGFGVCRADLTLDGTLDFFDVQTFLSAFAAGDPLADWNNDGLFDFFDVQAFLADFSAGCP